MPSKALNPTKRSGALDVLRFLAVLTVFFSHFTDTFNYVYLIVPENLKYVPIFKYGGICLLAFFMVSGYVVTMTSMKKNIIDFAVIRLSRIYPLFWISCIVAFILPRIVDHSYLLQSGLKTFLINMTMIPSLLGTTMINPVYHTLLLELIFYFFIGIVIVFRLWNRMLPIIGVITVFCIILGLDPTNYYYVFIPQFLAGVLFYYHKIKHGNPLLIKILILLNFISSLMTSRIFVRAVSNTNDDLQTPNVWVVATIISVIYIIFYLIVSEKLKIRSNRLTMLLGEIAYPFYLFHIYFLCIYWYFRNSIQGDILLFSILALVIVVSWLINRLLEKPLNTFFMQLAYRLLRLIRKQPNYPAIP